jgi:hypothetical protein
MANENQFFLVIKGDLALQIRFTIATNLYAVTFQFAK